MNKNERFIYDYFNALWLERDISVLDKCIAENVIVDGAIGFALGREGMRTLTQAWYLAFPHTNGSIERLISCGSQVSLRWHAQGQHEGTFCGVPATGKYLSYAGDCYFQIVDQKIVAYRASSTIYIAFAAEGIQLNIPEKKNHCSLLINAARYIGLIRLETIEVIVLALKIAGVAEQGISTLLHIPDNKVQHILAESLIRLGIKSGDLEFTLRAEGTIHVFMKLAHIILNSAL